MTNDLISREALLIEMAAGCMPLNEKGISGVTGDESTIYDYVKNAPAVDAAPVVHAEWIRIPTFDKKYRCSNWDCCRLMPTGYKPGDLKFCPHCGARMDKEANP